MRIKTDFDRNVREIENTWIPLADGTRLAARIWLPEDAEANPVPAILEYLPYRKTDSTAPRDTVNHPYFAGHGYAGVRVDMRGSGDSDGIMEDEYLPQEQHDALEVLRWLADQPWCTGDVGMIGISWGGFNGLQVAAHGPPELKAVVSICSTDDRYADDVHYMGGCVIGSEMLPWAANMFARNARPPDPEHVGERWRKIWFDRMERTPPFAEAWLSHQRRDDFWKQGSICEDFSDVKCPIYAVGGWADAYTNAIFRMLEGLSVPRKGLVGPWAHKYPHQGVPEPAIGFLQECVRWWDHWLKGIDTGIMDEPTLHAWLQDPAPPQTYYAERPGRWVTLPEWPTPNAETQRFTLNASSTLDEEAQQSESVDVASPQVAGLEAGTWCAYAKPAEMPGDQRADDGRSLCFTSPPLDQPLDILGFPKVDLTLSVDRPNALLAVRLCDVAPTGESTLVTRGLLNLTHRNSHEQPEPLEPNRPHEVGVELNAIGYTVPEGHRLRVSISPTYWPLAWPSPEPVTLTVHTGEASLLRLPIAPPDAIQPQDHAPFGEPESAAPMEIEQRRHGEINRYVHQDINRETTELTVYEDYGRHRLVDADLELESIQSDTYAINEGEPQSAKVTCERTLHLERGDWRIRIETTSVMTGDGEHFHLTNVLDAYEGDTRVFTKTWDASIPRDHV